MMLTCILNAALGFEKILNYKIGDVEDHQENPVSWKKHPPVENDHGE